MGKPIITQLGEKAAQQLFIPSGVGGQLVVGDDGRPALRLADHHSEA
jgi:hypothetical protein